MSIKSFILGTAAAVAVLAGSAQADVIVSANSAGFSTGPIGTFDFTTGLPVNSFMPDQATMCSGGSCNGRGLALTIDRFFYTELNGGFGDSTAIYVAPYNGGAGGSDIPPPFPNPIPGKGIQALAFGGAGNLYVLTGYPSTTPTVYILNGVTGATVGGPIVLQGADPGMDGFTILSDGTFLGNLGDAVNSYTHWDATGTNIGGNFQAPIDALGNPCGSATGVDVAPDGASLYFMCNFNTIVHTTLTGGYLSSMAAPGGLWEDIAVQQEFVCTGASCQPAVPEPGTLALFGFAVPALGLFLRRRRKTKA